MNLVTALTVLLACPTPRFIPSEPDVWMSPMVQAVVARAQQTCRVRYRGCLISLERRSVNNYWAVCRRNR